MYLIITDSSDGTISAIECTSEKINRVLVVTFDYTFKDEHSYQIKLVNKNSRYSDLFKQRVESENGILTSIECVDFKLFEEDSSLTAEVVYRGLILSTTQETQDYKLTNGKYSW